MNTQNETPELQKARREKTLKDGREAVKKARVTLERGEEFYQNLALSKRQLDVMQEEREAVKAERDAMNGVKRKKARRVKHRI